MLFTKYLSYENLYFEIKRWVFMLIKEHWGHQKCPILALLLASPGEAAAYSL